MLAAPQVNRYPANTSMVLTVSIMVSKTTGKGSNPFRRAIFPFSSAVEQRAVNSKVVGSNPARGAITFGKVGTGTTSANVRLGVGSNPTIKYLNPVASAHGGDLKISNNRTTECSSVG